MPVKLKSLANARALREAPVTLKSLANARALREAPVTLKSLDAQALGRMQ